MKKAYALKNGNIINSIKNTIDFTPDDVVTIYDFYYTDNKNHKRKINITIQKEIEFDGEEFFNKYQTEMRTYIEDDKLDYHYIEYVSYDDESGKEFDDIKFDRQYNIDFLFYKINESIDL